MKNKINRALFVCSLVGSFIFGAWLTRLILERFLTPQERSLLFILIIFLYLYDWSRKEVLGDS